VRFSEQERLFGAAKAHDTFDGILAEHALALEEARDMLREGLKQLPITRGLVGRTMVDAAVVALDDQITYVRALGGVAATEEEPDAE